MNYILILSGCPSIVRVIYRCLALTLYIMSIHIIDIQQIDQPLDMTNRQTDSLLQVFERTKLHTKDLEINKYSFYLRKLSRFCGQFSSTALVIDIFYVKYYSVLTQYQKIYLKIAITFLCKRYIYIQILFFCNFVRPKSYIFYFMKNGKNSTTSHCH